MTNTKELEKTVIDLITGALAAMGYDLVRVQLSPGGRFLTLQVMAERSDRKAMTVEDCVKISHEVSKHLDAADPLKGRYTLEVSSPGTDRPLVRLQDFERFAGHTARIELAAPLGGLSGSQRRFEGSIVRVTKNEEIALKTEQGEVCLPANAIAKAKLVPGDVRRSSKGGTRH